MEVDMKYEACVRAAWRIAVAASHPDRFGQSMFDDYRDFEDACTLVVELLEAASDELKPLLEERARASR